MYPCGCASSTRSKMIMTVPSHAINNLLKVLQLHSIGEYVQCVHRLQYVLNIVAATNNTSRRTAAGGIIALCTYLQPWRGTARGLRSFRACTITQMQLAGRNVPCKQCCANGLQHHIICEEDVTAVRRTLQRLQICSRDTIASSLSSNLRTSAN